MKINLILLLIMSQTLVFCQVKNEGIIKFKQTNYLSFENMPDDAPKSVETAMQLSFTESESIYQKDPDVVITEDEPNGNRWMRRMRDRTNRIYYKNLDDESILEQVGLFNKEFLVKDSIANFKWKVSAGEQKDILGYMCMKASYKDSIQNFIVFFTPQIPISTGPDEYGKLPGLILEYQSENKHIIATQIDLEKLKNPIAKPDKGNAMTRTEFNKMREEKMKEQKEMWGGRGRGSGRGGRN